MYSFVCCSRDSQSNCFDGIAQDTHPFQSFALKPKQKYLAYNHGCHVGSSLHRFLESVAWATSSCAPRCGSAATFSFDAGGTTSRILSRALSTFKCTISCNWPAVMGRPAMHDRPLRRVMKVGMSSRKWSPSKSARLLLRPKIPYKIELSVTFESNSRVRSVQESQAKPCNGQYCRLRCVIIQGLRKKAASVAYYNCYIPPASSEESI